MVVRFEVMDGPMGSELSARGVDTSGAAWSAQALVDAPEIVQSVHGAYVAAGATVHRTNTFRTRPRTVGSRWSSLASLAASLAQAAVPHGQRVAGSLGPLEDCYRPDLARTDEGAAHEHESLAWLLADDGVDLLMCETFPAADEAVVATRAARRTGLSVWTSLTAGPNADLQDATTLAEGALRVVDAGAELVLVNCVAATRTLAYVDALAQRGIPFGVYANAAVWNGPRISDAEYVALAREWLARGARVLGSCCGTTPETTRALAALRDEGS